MESHKKPSKTIANSVKKLQHKVDLTSDEILNLKDEISLQQSRLKRTERENNEYTDLLEKTESKPDLLQEKQKQEQELKALKIKVELHLELTEEMEENELLDSKRAQELLVKAEEAQNETIISLKAEIAEKRKELEAKAKKVD